MDAGSARAPMRSRSALATASDAYRPLTFNDRGYDRIVQWCRICWSGWIHLDI